jgi:hypothetical protein
MTTPEPGGRGRGLLAEAKDAVTPRAFLLVCGVALLQLAFIASYIGAFHQPTAHQIPISVTAPAVAGPTTVARLNALPGQPLKATLVPDAAAGLAKLNDRSSYGLLEVNATSVTDHLTVASAASPSTVQAVTAALQAAEAASSRTLVIRDVNPPASGDHNGLSAFYLAIGWTIGGYLAASLLGVSAGARPLTLNRVTIRLIALALYAAVTSLLGALIVGPWLHALPDDMLGLWGIGTLVVFAAGAFTTSLMTLAGVPGIGLTIIVFVIAGNPSAGGAYGWPLLPAFWAAIGPWLPPGAATDAIRGAVYFGNTAITRDLLVLGGYALAGLLVTYLVLMLTGRRRVNGLPVRIADRAATPPATR